MDNKEQLVYLPSAAGLKESVRESDEVVIRDREGGDQEVSRRIKV